MPSRLLALQLYCAIAMQSPRYSTSFGIVAPTIATRAMATCLDTTAFQDQWGSCSAYRAHKWCAAGRRGPGWQKAWGALPAAAQAACCVCGGGKKPAAGGGRKPAAAGASSWGPQITGKCASIDLGAGHKSGADIYCRVAKRLGIQECDSVIPELDAVQHICESRADCAGVWDFSSDNKGLRLCRLGSLKVASGSGAHNMWRKPDADACASTPCQHGGTCAIVNEVTSGRVNSTKRCSSRRGFHDARGGCKAYTKMKWCTAKGSVGPGWDPSWGTNISAAARASCCACGGGMHKVVSAHRRTQGRAGFECHCLPGYGGSTCTTAKPAFDVSFTTGAWVYNKATHTSVTPSSVCLRGDGKHQVKATLSVPASAQSSGPLASVLFVAEVWLNVSTGSNPWDESNSGIPAFMRFTSSGGEVSVVKINAAIVTSWFKRGLWITASSGGALELIMQGVHGEFCMRQPQLLTNSPPLTLQLSPSTGPAFPPGRPFPPSKFWAASPVLPLARGAPRPAADLIASGETKMLGWSPPAGAKMAIPLRDTFSLVRLLSTGSSPTATTTSKKHGSPDGDVVLRDAAGALVTQWALLWSRLDPWVNTTGAVHPILVLDNVPYAFCAPGKCTVKPAGSADGLIDGHVSFGQNYGPDNVPEYGRWIETLLRAMVSRYGIGRASGFWFRVGTEPNTRPGHWADTNAKYVAEYAAVAGAVDKVLPRAKVGLANMGADGGNWDEVVMPMARGIAASGARVDFIAMSCYGRGTPAKHNRYDIGSAELCGLRLNSLRRLGGERWAKLPAQSMEYGLQGNVLSLVDSDPGVFGAAWTLATSTAHARNGIQRAFHWNFGMLEFAHDDGECSPHVSATPCSLYRGDAWVQAQAGHLFGTHVNAVLLWVRQTKNQNTSKTRRIGTGCGMSTVCRHPLLMGQEIYGVGRDMRLRKHAAWCPGGA